MGKCDKVREALAILDKFEDTREISLDEVRERLDDIFPNIIRP